MSRDLNELLEYLGAHAHNVLLIERQKELMPLYHLCPAEGPDLVIGCPWRNTEEKLLVLQLIKQKAREIDATCLGFLSEVWMTLHPTSDISNVTPPSLDPKRIECVLAMVTDGDEVKSRSWEIVRDRPEGVVIHLQQKDYGDGFMTGRMVDDLLPKRKTRH